MSAETSTYSAYKRFFLLSRPYTGRLLVGILAGLISAGSLLGVYQQIPKLIEAFEADLGVKESVSQQSVVPVPRSVDQADGSVKKVSTIQKWMDEFGIQARDDSGRMTWQFLVVSLVFLPVIVIIRALMIYLNRYYMKWIASRVVRDMRDSLFVNLQRQSLKFFGRTDVGRLISNCTNDVSLVENIMSVTISELTLAPLQIVVSLAFIINYAYECHVLGVIFILLLAFPMCIFPLIMLGRRVRRHTRTALNRISDVVSRMHEIFTGIKVVKAYSMEDHESVRFRDMNAHYFRHYIKALRAELLMTPMMEAVAIIIGCAFIIVCYALDVRLSQIIAIGVPAVFVYRPTKQLAQLHANLQRGSAAFERIYELTDVDTSIKESKNPVALKAFDGKIVFDDVSFDYGDGSSFRLDGMSFDIPKGSVVAVVGATGSGKSTMSNLLARFYDPVGGRITIDGHDLRDVTIKSLRSMMKVITQETILFNDTIASNIAYGAGEVSRDELVEAAKKANAHQFIMENPEGYERVVGEKGSNLSGGERQRIAIARAILKNPPILILDEATSALDTVTERLVQEAIGRVMNNRTVFAIAHRLSTIRHANLILLMEKGCIVERGTHEALYNAGGRYRKLCDMQVLD